jgi:hypothetical protein
LVSCCTGGRYRDECESLAADLAEASRIYLMTEGIESLRELFD